MNGAICFDNVGKAYKRYPSHFDKWLETLTLQRIPRHQPQWVLRHVTLSVRSGEAVGIIGYNGAGKSTLLKLVAGVTNPTEGQISVVGRVAAILELGIGFHPDLSGRQNIYLGARLLGYSDREISHVESSIVDFCELGRYIEEPLRTYSSGMQARLAFAVATAMVPDVLIIDEALSVGDAYFQHKSFARIRELRDSGATLLFVSHDFGAIRTLCDRTVLLGEGGVLKDGSPIAVLDYYNALIAERERASEIAQQETRNGVTTQSGDGAAQLASALLLDDQGRPATRFRTNEKVRLRLETESLELLPELVAGLMIRDRAGNPVFGTNSWHLQQRLTEVPPGARHIFDFDFPMNLGPGSYSVTIALSGGQTHLERNYLWRDNLLVFEVINLEHQHFIGSTWLPVSLNVQSVLYPSLSA